MKFKDLKIGKQFLRFNPHYDQYWQYIRTAKVVVNNSHSSNAVCLFGVNAGVFHLVDDEDDVVPLNVAPLFK